MESKVILPDGREVTLRVCTPETYTPNLQNTNKGTARGKSAIDESLRLSGFHRGIVVAGDGTVVNGNHTYQSASELGIVGAWIEVEVEGDVGVVTKRIDWESAQDPKAIAAALADNRVSELNYEIDPEFLEDAVNHLDNLKIPASIFTTEELSDLIEDSNSVMDELLDDMDDEDDDRGVVRNDRNILPIALSWEENRQWEQCKEALGVQRDKPAFLRLVSMYLAQQH